jgi:hypothetical protein
VACRRSDLARFGEFSWRIRDEIAVIRRVIAVLEHGSPAFRELAVAWSEDERDRSVAVATRARRWGTLSSLTAAIGRALPRPRGRPAPSIGTRPRDPVVELDAGSVAAIVARCSAAARWGDAALVGVIGETGKSAEEVSELRAHAIAGLELTEATRGALAVLCDGRRSSAYIFGGLRRGSPIAVKTIHDALERNGTTVAALRRAAKGER